MPRLHHRGDTRIKNINYNLSQTHDRDPNPAYPFHAGIKGCKN